MNYQAWYQTPRGAWAMRTFHDVKSCLTFLKRLRRERRNCNVTDGAGQTIGGVHDYGVYVYDWQYWLEGQSTPSTIQMCQAIDRMRDDKTMEVKP